MKVKASSKYDEIEQAKAGMFPCIGVIIHRATSYSRFRLVNFINGTYGIKMWGDPYFRAIPLADHENACVMSAKYLKYIDIAFIICYDQFRHMHELLID